MDILKLTINLKSGNTVINYVADKEGKSLIKDWSIWKTIMYSNMKSGKLPAATIGLTAYSKIMGGSITSLGTFYVVLDDIELISIELRP